MENYRFVQEVGGWTQTETLGPQGIWTQDLQHFGTLDVICSIMLSWSLVFIIPASCYKDLCVIRKKKITNCLSLGCLRKQSQRQIFLGNDFIEKCKPRKAGGETEACKAGKSKAPVQDTSGSWVPF